MRTLGIDHYLSVLDTLNTLPINTLFAKSVIYRQVPGSIYVDNIEEPQAFYIVHPYGMSLLFGKTDNEEFNKELACYLVNKDKVRNRQEWLQVYPEEWSTKIDQILETMIKSVKDGSMQESPEHDDRFSIQKNTRVNFCFDITKFKKSNNQPDDEKYKIEVITKEIYQNISGSVIPRYFWKDENQFLDSGIGYSVIYDGEIAATAFSAFKFGNQLEIGIETAEKFRGKGLAFHACSALINYCIDQGYEPVWACRKENVASFGLAQKLGFSPTYFIPNYLLTI